MLVLARKCGESIVIGDDVRVAIVRVKGNRVKLAIEAPREISVERGERVELELIQSATGLPETCEE